MRMMNCHSKWYFIKGGEGNGKALASPLFGQKNCKSDDHYRHHW